ncbi:MAG: hypothetical protein ACSHYA_18935 [Opitutaceae bacterium]
MRKSILALVSLLLSGTIYVVGGEKKLVDVEFEFEGKRYSIVRSWAGRVGSNWSYLESDVAPVTFKAARGLLEKEIFRAFPKKVFQISELNLNTNSAGYAYYHARLTHLIDGNDYSYTHLNLEVYMDGTVSKIRMIDPVLRPAVESSN